MIVEKPTSLTTSFRFSNFPVARRMYAGLSSIDVRPSSVIVKTFCVIRGLILSCNFKTSSARVPDVPSMASDNAGLEVEEIWSVDPGDYIKRVPDLDHAEYLLIAHRPKNGEKK